MFPNSLSNSRLQHLQEPDLSCYIPISRIWSQTLQEGGAGIRPSRADSKFLPEDIYSQLTVSGSNSWLRAVSWQLLAVMMSWWQ